jgi:NodT family efflux transporter outer membrane factor (OMF) lipoprotein
MAYTSLGNVAFAACMLASILMTGCAVGPDFQKPKDPDVHGYTVDPLSTTSNAVGVGGGAAQHFVNGRDIPADWWTLFHSKALNELIERSLQNSPDLKAGQAALRVAQENVLAQKGAYYPSVSGSFSASRQQTSAEVSPTPNSGALTFNLFAPQVNVSYVPDVFGLNQRTVESLNAQAEQVRYALMATQIALSANVAAAAVQEASLRAQIDATQKMISINSETVQILRDQFEKGYAARLDLAAQESQLAQVTASLPPLLKQLSQQRDLLSDLSGAFPDAALPETFELSGLELPQQLPISLPSKLVEQRPDILQAEENMHSASAQIGVAVANRLPNINLTADIGSNALAIGQVFSSGAGIWAVGAGITQPIVDGGQLLHRERAARATYDEASEQYQSTVLTAFQNVADALNALKHDADTLQAATAAVAAAGVTLDISRQQAQAGYTNNLALLNAEQTYQQAQINLVQAQASRFSDTAALFLALGGGWWNQDTAAAVASDSGGNPGR